MEGCRPSDELDRTWGYSRNLLRCTCGRHAWAGVLYADAGDAAKAVGAALSWTRRERPGKRLRFVLGAGDRIKCEQAAYAIQSLVGGDQVELLVDGDAWAPEPRSDLFKPDWAKAIADRQDRLAPSALDALASKASVDRFCWYRSVTGQGWSGRLRGLEVCRVTDSVQAFLFGVGRPGAPGDGDGGVKVRRISAARVKFLEVAAELAGPGTSDVGDVALPFTRLDSAAHLLRRLADARIEELASAEHMLEADVLAGRLRLVAGGSALQPLEQRYPFQFPTRWWPGGKPRYVDVLAHAGDVPWLVELKVDGGQGSYIRDGIVQVALYRECVRRAASVDPWFRSMKLDRRKTRAALVIPPLVGKNREALLEDHLGLAKLFEVELIVEPRATKASLLRRDPSSS